MPELSSPPPPLPATAPALAVSPSFRLRSQTLNSLRLRRLFDLFDLDGDDEITVSELSAALQRLGLGPTENADLSSVIAPFVPSGHSGLAFDDFAAFHRALGDTLLGGASAEDPETEEEEMKEAFGIFDEDGDGFISAAELRSVLEKLGLGEGWSDENVKSMIGSVDRDRDGMVDFNEFKCMMRTIEVKN